MQNTKKNYDSTSKENDPEKSLKQQIFLGKD